MIDWNKPVRMLVNDLSGHAKKVRTVEVIKRLDKGRRLLLVEDVRGEMTLSCVVNDIGVPVNSQLQKFLAENIPPKRESKYLRFIPSADHSLSPSLQGSFLDVMVGKLSTHAVIRMVMRDGIVESVSLDKANSE